MLSAFLQHPGVFLRRWWMRLMPESNSMLPSRCGDKLGMTALAVLRILLDQKKVPTKMLQKVHAKKQREMLRQILMAS